MKLGCLLYLDQLRLCHFCNTSWWRVAHTPFAVVGFSSAWSRLKSWQFHPRAWNYFNPRAPQFWTHLGVPGAWPLYTCTDTHALERFLAITGNAGIKLGFVLLLGNIYLFLPCWPRVKWSANGAAKSLVRCKFTPHYSRTTSRIEYESKSRSQFCWASRPTHICRSNNLANVTSFLHRSVQHPGPSISCLHLWNWSSSKRGEQKVKLLFCGGVETEFQWYKFTMRELNLVSCPGYKCTCHRVSFGFDSVRPGLTLQWGIWSTKLSKLPKMQRG